MSTVGNNLGLIVNSIVVGWLEYENLGTFDWTEKTSFSFTSRRNLNSNEKTFLDDSQLRPI